MGWNSDWLHKTMVFKVFWQGHCINTLIWICWCINMSRSFPKLETIMNSMNKATAKNNLKTCYQVCYYKNLLAKFVGFDSLFPNFTEPVWRTFLWLVPGVVLHVPVYVRHQGFGHLVRERGVTMECSLEGNTKNNVTQRKNWNIDHNTLSPVRLWAQNMFPWQEVYIMHDAHYLYV